MEQAESAAYYRVWSYAVRKPDTWLEVVPIRVVVRIRISDHTTGSRNRVRCAFIKSDNSALTFVPIVWRSNGAIVAKALAHRRIKFVPQAQVQSQFLIDAPIVLEVERVPPFPETSGRDGLVASYLAQSNRKEAKASPEAASLGLAAVPRLLKLKFRSSSNRYRLFPPNALFHNPLRHMRVPNPSQRFNQVPIPHWKLVVASAQPAIPRDPIT